MFGTQPDLMPSNLQYVGTEQRNKKMKRQFVRLLTVLIAIHCIQMSIPSVAAKSTSIGGDFELTSHLGEPFSLHDIKGKVGVLFFGFTHCPDVCPNTLLEIQRLLVNLDTQASQLAVLFISVDPKRDTTDKLESYVKYFNQNIIGLTGTSEQVNKVLAQYNASVSFSGDTESDYYNVEHTANIFLIDRKGRLASIILPRTPYPVLEQQVRKLIDQ